MSMDSVGNVSHTVVFSILRFFTDARLCWTGLSLRANSVEKYVCGAPGHKQELDICSWSRAARSSTQRDCVRWCHHLCLVLLVGVLIGSSQQVAVTHWSRTFNHGHLLIASRAPKCRVAILVSTETAAKDARLLTSAKKHPTQFSFSGGPTRVSYVAVCTPSSSRCFESNQEPNSDFHQTTYLVCYLRIDLFGFRWFRWKLVLQFCIVCLDIF